MKILITKQNNPEWSIYFPGQALDKLREMGEVELNERPEPFTADELRSRIRDADICITHWGTPAFTKDILQNANKLKMIAHAAGSVANVVTDEVYKRGIRVVSANQIMARFVAEGVLSYILAGLKLIPQHCADMKNGIWNRRITEINTLFNAKIGLIGLGSIGRYLLDLLKPFDVSIKIYDPYVSAEFLNNYGNIEMCTVEDILTWGDIISIHASLTEETRHMINADRLKLIKDGALFVNTARGLIVDEKALIEELEKNRFRAILDVYEKEPLDINSPLLKMENVIVMPHVAGASGKEQLTYCIIDEIGRFINGLPLEHEINFDRYKMMTKE